MILLWRRRSQEDGRGALDGANHVHVVAFFGGLKQTVYLTHMAKLHPEYDSAQGPDQWVRCAVQPELVVNLKPLKIWPTPPRCWASDPKEPP